MPNLSQGRAALIAVILEPKEIQNQGALQKRERAMIAMFEGPDRNRNIIIVVAVVVVAVIIFLYSGGHLSGII